MCRFQHDHRHAGLTIFQRHLETVGGVRIEHHVVTPLGETNGLDAIGVRALAGDKSKIRHVFPVDRGSQVERLPLVDLGPQLADHRRIATDQIEHEALEVGGFGNIHRRAGGDAGFGSTARTVDTGAEKFVEYVVFVGGEHQLLDRQTHLAGNVAGADVAEVARRHGKGDLLVVRFRGQEVTLEVIDDLRRDARPVDRIDGPDLVFLLELGVIGNRLDDILRVIKQPGDGDIEDVGVGQRIHLGALKGAHLAIRRKHEDLDVVLATHGVFGRRTGVAGGRAKDVDRLATLVEHVFEQIAEQLHGHVLEGQRRAVREFLRVQAVFQFGQRRNPGCVAAVAGVAIDIGGIGLADQRLQISRRNIGDEL